MDALIQSSNNPKEVSMTVQGMLIALVPIIVAIFQQFNISVAQTDVVTIIQQGVACVAGIMMLIGTVRKVYYQFVK
jgi:uncharacterized protein YlxP (DUF503 family)